LVGIFLLSAFARVATVSNHAGLKLELAANGDIAGVAMNGTKLPQRTADPDGVRPVKGYQEIPFEGTLPFPNLLDRWRG
jgi:hypothetical protein